MPFAVGYDDHIPQDFKDLPALHKLMFRMLVGSFRYDRWLTGRPIVGLASPGIELMELQNGPIRLVYELDREAEQVRIVAIVRD